MVTRLKVAQPEKQAILKKERAAREAVAEGIRQYNAILPTIDAAADTKGIAVLLEVWRATHELYLSNCRTAEAVGLSIPMTGKRLRILRTLHFAPENRLSLGALSKIVNLSPAAATNYVDSLSRGSLVRRSATEGSHTNIIELTPKGEAAFQAIVPEMSKTWTEACACFTEAEKDTLIGLLKRLIPPNTPAPE